LARQVCNYHEAALVDAGLAPPSRLCAVAFLSFTFPTLPPGENDA